MYREMLRCGQGFKILWIATLQSGDESNPHFRSQERVFAVRFLTAAPTGIAKNIYVRRPDREAVKPTAITFCAQFFVVLRAKLGSDDASLGVKQVRVEAGGHADCLRKDRCVAGVSDAVEPFAPPVVRRNAKPRDGWRCMHHLLNFF